MAWLPTNISADARLTKIETEESNVIDITMPLPLMKLCTGYKIKSDGTALGIRNYRYTA